jgi:tRNA (guanine37-N1)-methyltransferase
MRFDVITIFPEMFDAVTRQGITARAIERGLWQLHCWNPRDFAVGAYRSVDDRPYGGGPGMVMMAEPLAAAIDAVRERQRVAGAPDAPVIHLSPRGRPLDHARVAELAARPAVTLLAGRYEAVDQRLLDRHVDEEVAIGDFVVSGGELPALMLIDAVVRLLPGALNDERSAIEESFATGVLDCPHYTRPEVFEGVPVPPVLLSGHHARILRWRREQALAATLRSRPDLLERARRDGRLSADDEQFLGTLVTDARTGISG